MLDLELYEDKRGREPVGVYIKTLERQGRSAEIAAVFRHMDLLRDEGPSLGMPYARMIDKTDRIYELRPGAHRVAFAVRKKSMCLATRMEEARTIIGHCRT